MTCTQMDIHYRIFTPAIAVMFLTAINHAYAEIQPDRIHTAANKKTNFYLQDGMFNGGDGKVESYIVKDIRGAKNGEFERAVIDLEGTLHGEPSDLVRPPYYQIEVSPELKRIVLSLSGKVKLKLNPQKIKQAFKSSSIIESVNLFSPIEGEPWMIELKLKSESPVEVFQLTQSQPLRVILDIRHKKD